GAGRGGGLPPGPDPPHERAGIRTALAVARGDPPSRSLPRLPRVRDGVSFGGPLRLVDRGRAAVRRGPSAARRPLGPSCPGPRADLPALGGVGLPPAPAPW